VDKYQRVYVNFAPAVSRAALKAMRQAIRGWHLQLKCDRELPELAAMFNPILRGWQQYYGRFYGSAMSVIWEHMNDYLVRWMMRKYKSLASHKTRARHALGRLGACRTSFLFKCPKKPTELKEKQKGEPICMETALLDL
jgi:RNA-directed DNA polymerase